MDQRTHLRREIDTTVVQLTNKVRALEARANHAKQRVENALSIEHHARERPWTVVGAAVACGLALSWLFG